MSWCRSYRLRFAHCDPAGIAYYPRLFELADAAIEDWTAETIAPRRTMHEEMRLGMPTVTLQSEFFAPAHLGDELEIALSVTALGASSIDFIIAVSTDKLLFTTHYRQVLMNLDTQRAAHWPAEIRARLEAQIEVAS